MSDIDFFADMMTTKIVVQNPSTGPTSMFGVGGLSTGGSTFMAHVMESDGSNRKLAGIDEHLSVVAWMNNTSTSAVTRRSSFVFPDGSRPPVKSVTYPRDDDGSVHHTKVVFG